MSPSTRWQAFAGMLPFLAFGLASMTANVDHIYHIRGHYAEMAVYFLVLTGLLIGWTRGFPLWSYSYLGWSLLIAWANTNSRIYGVDWDIWVPFGITILIALLWTHSLTPIKKFFRDIWNDWTRLTFVMYAFVAFTALIYDENHHPYLLLLMAVSTLIITAGAWFFLRSSNLTGRVLSIVVSFFLGGIVPTVISYLTWDWRAYYGLPQSDYWYDNLGVAPIGVLFWLLILFSPALFVLIQRTTARRTA